MKKSIILLQMLTCISGQVLNGCNDVKAVYSANTCCSDDTQPLSSPLQAYPLATNRVTVVVRAETEPLSVTNATKVQQFRDAMEATATITPTLPGGASFNSIIYDTFSLEIFSYEHFTKHPLLLAGGVFNGKLYAAAKAEAGLPADINYLSGVGFSVKEIRIIANDKAAAEQYYYTDSKHVLPDVWPNKTLAEGFQSWGWTFSVQQGNGWRF